MSKSTIEYLNEVLEQVKKGLPAWKYRLLERKVLAKSIYGDKRRMQPLEKLFITKAGESSLSNSELKSALYRLNRTFAAQKRQKKDYKDTVNRARRIIEEMKKRGIKPEGACVAECKKGFDFGPPQGGFHAHGIKRLQNKTWSDGDHMHAFIMPGTNQVIYTSIAGRHEHTLNPDTNRTVKGGAHSHELRLPDGRVLDTKLDGTHSHDLMLETTGFDGSHQHDLVLADGTILKSLTVQEEYEALGVKDIKSAPIYDAYEVSSSLQRARVLSDRVAFLEMLLEDRQGPEVAEDFMFEMAKGQHKEFPPLVAEVLEVGTSHLYCSFDSENTFKVNKNEKLDPVEGDLLSLSYDCSEALGFADPCVPHDEPSALNIANKALEYERLTRTVGFQGPKNAKVVFVAAQPNALEIARKQAIVGPDGALFSEKYLSPLGLTKKEIAIGFVNPTLNECDPMIWRDQLYKNLEGFEKAKVVALGRVAREVLGEEKVDYFVPHPAGIRRHSDAGEVLKKMKRLRKVLDAVNSVGDDTQDDSVLIQETEKSNADCKSEGGDKGHLVGVSKSASEKQIVYGVVLDPYQVDLHNDWIPPEEIESTAHDFLSQSRVVGFEHKGKVDAQVVESWVEAYPTKEDHRKAIAGKPHDVSRRSFGNDKVHSGAWIIGVKMSDELWGLHKDGKLNAFSIGGFSLKSETETAEMPDINIIDLEPSR